MHGQLSDGGDLLIGTEAAGDLPFLGAGNAYEESGEACRTRGNLRKTRIAPTTLGGSGSLYQRRIEAQ